ncbi:MAG: DUF488 domain-containing protein [Gammaproteobacteria bacterium]
MNEPSIYTLGHSDRTKEAFLQLLKGAGIRHLLDIRTFPQSRRFPHFDSEAIRELVEGVGIVYHRVGRPFGGRRDASPASPHLALDESLRGFADYMASDAFDRAVKQLISLADREGPLALMCAERLPEHCHRRLLADTLLLRGREVWHLIDTTQTRRHMLSPEGRQVGGQLVYDRGANETLTFH